MRSLLPFPAIILREEVNKFFLVLNGAGWLIPRWHDQLYANSHLGDFAGVALPRHTGLWLRLPATSTSVSRLLVLRS